MTEQGDSGEPAEDPAPKVPPSKSEIKGTNTIARAVPMTAIDLGDFTAGEEVVTRDQPG